MIGVLKSNTLVALTREVTQGTPVEPTLPTDFVQVLADGLEINPIKEVLERTILTTNIGTPAGMNSTESVEGAFAVEYKGSGGPTPPQYGLAIESCLGGTRDVITQTTTALGTINTFEVTGHAYEVGDLVVLKIAGANHVAFVQSILADVITFVPSLPVGQVVPLGTVITPSVTYFPTNTNQPTITATYYLGNEIKQQGTGCRVSSMSLENFETGQIPTLNFSYNGLSFSRVDGAAPVVPTFQPNLPPVVLGATLSLPDGVCIKMNTFSLSVENTIAPLNTVCSPSGTISSFVTKRASTGTFNPYLDDTTVEWFNKFDSNAIFSLTLTLGVPSIVAGEVLAGSVVAIYMPQVKISEIPTGDVEGILTDEISFQASTGADGTGTDVFMAFA